MATVYTYVDPVTGFQACLDRLLSFYVEREREGKKEGKPMSVLMKAWIKYYRQ